MIEEQVPPALAGERLDRIVALTDATPLFIYSLRQPDGRHRVAVEQTDRVRSGP